MNKVTKKILTLLMAVTLVVGMFTTTYADETKKINVTFTIERFTIGQGFLVEPVTVQVKEGAAAKDVLEEVAKEKNLTINLSSYGYYIDSISYADTGVINIPESIQKMPSIDVDYGYGNQHYDAPTNTSTNALFTDDQKLGSGSYSSLAGWMYTVNNVAPDVAMDSQPVKDGDVIRLQFSVYAGGADLGFVSYYENIESAKLPNKDALTKLVANTSDNPQVAAKAEAIKVLANYDATQEDVDAAYTNLEKVQVTTATQKTTLKKASIKSLKNVKGKKVKIKINKVTGAKGYQVTIKVIDENAPKNKVYIKSTLKGNKLSKKLQKKVLKVNAKINGSEIINFQVKIRGYKLKKNKKVYTKWSTYRSKYAVVD